MGKKSYNDFIDSLFDLKYSQWVKFFHTVLYISLGVSIIAILLNLKVILFFALLAMFLTLPLSLIFLRCPTCGSHVVIRDYNFYDAFYCPYCGEILD